MAHIYRYVYCQMNVFFFYFLLNHFPKTHRNFWDVYDVNLQEKKFGRSTAYSCRTNFFRLFYNFKGKKTPTQVFSCGICETFKNGGGWFWKHVTYYYIIKNYIGYTLAIFNAELLLYCIYCHPNNETCDSSMMWHDFQRNKQTAEMCARNKIKYCSCCIILIRIDTILSKNILNNFQNLLLMKLLAQSCNQTDIFWRFFPPADILWLSKTIERVLGYTTDQ